jgi:hypothetical protein
MMKAYIAGYKGVGSGSKFIQWFSNGRYSHVSLIFDYGDGHPLEVDALQGRGVTARSFGELDRPFDLFELHADPLQVKVMYRAAREQVGKKYDWGGIWGFVRRALRQNPDRWFCSELVAWVCAVGGVVLLRLPAYKFTPVLVCASTKITQVEVPSYWRLAA